ncbi:unnamed protein product, partial [Amoebophrya sp. A25]|eukprot:GSA25T00004252001.1
MSLRIRYFFEGDTPAAVAELNSAGALCTCYRPFACSSEFLAAAIDFSSLVGDASMGEARRRTAPVCFSKRRKT